MRRPMPSVVCRHIPEDSGNFQAAAHWKRRSDCKTLRGTWGDVQTGWEMAQVVEVLPSGGRHLFLDGNLQGIHLRLAIKCWKLQYWLDIF